MNKVTFDELKKDVYFNLVYPEDILATRKKAMEILHLSNYYLNKLRKEFIITGFPLCGSIFFYKEDLYNYAKDVKIAIENEPEFPKNLDYEEIEKRVYIKLFYPDDILLTRKTAPSFIKVQPRVFKILIERGELKEYEYDCQGVKFYFKTDLGRWALKNEKLLTRLRGV